MFYFCRMGISVECLYSKNAGEKIPVLSVVDDGVGMSHQDIVRMLSFGHKQPEEENPDRIGRFGIGFKVNIFWVLLLADLLNIGRRKSR